MVHKLLLLIPIVAIMVALSLSIPNVHGVTTVNNTNFSIDVPDNWAYREYLFAVNLSPNEFGVFLVNNTKPLDEKMKGEGAYASFTQDWLYEIKNAGLDLYVESQIDEQTGMNVTSKQNVTIDGEPAVKINADGINSFNGIKFVQYKIMYDKEPYDLGYMGNVKDFQKYLPQFEQIVKTFKFTK